MNFSNDKEYNKNDNKNIDFAAILTGKEEVPVVDTLDTALATFQSKDNEDLKFSVKITEMSNIKEGSIDVGKHEKGETVAELFQSETPTDEVTGKLCEGDLSSQDLKGPLQGKKTEELVEKIENGEAYVNISTEDKPKGKVRGQIKKLDHI